MRLQTLIAFNLFIFTFCPNTKMKRFSMSIHFCSSSPTKETKKSTATSIGCVRQVTEKSAHQMYIGFWIACESKEWANIHSKYALDDHCGISSLISILLTICSWLHAFCIQNDSHQFQAATYTPVCMHAAWKITFCEQFWKRWQFGQQIWSIKTCIPFSGWIPLWVFPFRLEIQNISFWIQTIRVT